jgi:hypothetical protein
VVLTTALLADHLCGVVVSSCLFGLGRGSGTLSVAQWVEKNERRSLLDRGSSPLKFVNRTKAVVEIGLTVMARQAAAFE